MKNNLTPQDLTQILNQALNKALITDRIQNPNSNKIAEWVDNFIKNNNLNPNYANKGDFCAVCGSDEFWSDEKDVQKIIIELSPFDAMQIMDLNNSFIYKVYHFGTQEQIKEYKKYLISIHNYNQQILAKATNEQIDDAYSERAVRNLLDELNDAK